jgi:hypothetical protein
VERQATFSPGSSGKEYYRYVPPPEDLHPEKVLLCSGRKKDKDSGRDRKNFSFHGIQLYLYTV